MTIELTNTFAPSGAFYPTAGLQQSILPDGLLADSCNDSALIYNPGVLERYRNSFAVSEVDLKVAEWLIETRRAPLVLQSDLDEYARVAVQLAQDLSDNPSNLWLGPLRGAARPCLLLKAMASGRCDFKFFNFSGGSQPGNAARVTAELSSILNRSNPHTDTYRITVADTAIGGHGINALTRMLSTIKSGHAQYRLQTWCIDLRIIHANDARTDVSNIEHVRSLAWPSFAVSLTRYPVPSLIVEDYDAALGLKIVTSDGEYLAKPSYEDGRFLLKASDGTRLIATDSLVTTFDQLFAQSITDEMVTNADLVQIGNVWSEYQQKG